MFLMFSAESLGR